MRTATSAARSPPASDCDVPRSLSIFFYLSAVVVLAASGFILAGFFVSRAWLPELTTGNAAEMNAAVAEFQMRSALHTALRASEFPDYNHDAKTRPLAPNGQDACPASAVSCSTDVADKLSDRSTHCCPTGYHCFEDEAPSRLGAMSEISVPLCGELQPGSSPASPHMRLASPDAVARCLLLTGMLDRQTRMPPPAEHSWPEAPENTELALPTSVPRSVEQIALRRRVVLLNEFAAINDFFQYKLVDIGGLLAFAGLGLAMLLAFLDTVTSFLPTSSREFRSVRQPAVYSAIGGTGHDSSTGFEVSCGALWSLNSPFAPSVTGAPAPAAALRYFSVFRLSLISVLLLLPAAFALLLTSHFAPTAELYDALESNGCFSSVLASSSGGVGSIAFFSERRMHLTAMKALLIVLLVLHVARAVIFYLACLWHHRFLKPKGKGAAAEDDLFGMPVDDLDDDFDRDIHRFPVDANAAAKGPSRFDSDYESDEEFDHGFAPRGSESRGAPTAGAAKIAAAQKKPDPAMFELSGSKVDDMNMIEDTGIVIAKK